MIKRNYLATLLLITLASCGSGNGGSNEPQASSEPEASSDPNYSFVDGRTNAKGSVNYEIFVRSFYDHNGDGIGDLLGVKDKLPYLADLGIKTIWLMPIHKSPTYHGYDVTDYYSVHPDYGTLNDFDALVEAAEGYGIDVMIDMVLNHSSKQHPWFTQSYNDFINNNTDSNSKQDWYNWSEESQSGYTRYQNAYYECQFGDSMPDLNLSSEAVRKEIDSILRFWINDHGVKGFRLDAVKYYDYGSVDGNIEFLNWLMETARKYDSNFYMVGEDWESDVNVLRYYASDVQSYFHFDGCSYMINTSKGYGTASRFVDNFVSFIDRLKEKNPTSYAANFLSNHDTDRPSFSTVEHAKVAATLNLMLPGDAWMYYGEEIQMKGNRLSEMEGSDVKRRLPMIWSKENKTGECGFPEKNRMDLNTTVQVEYGAEDMINTPRSLVNHYKKLINARNGYPCFKQGKMVSLLNEMEEESGYVIGYKVVDGNDSVKVYTNLTNEAKEFTVTGTKILEDIDTVAVQSTLNGNKLILAPYSTVLMD